MVFATRRIARLDWESLSREFRTSANGLSHASSNVLARGAQARA
jgi:hypothetical protein